MALLKCPGVAFTQWMARRPEKVPVKETAFRITGVQPPVDADICLMAVSDQAIPAIARELNPGNCLLLHTSGATPMSALQPWERRGVFYPLQTFSARRPVSFNNLPILWETAQADDAPLLEQLMLALGVRSIPADSDARRKAHLAAVFANNFSNHMVTLGQRLCAQYGLDPTLLDPITEETFAKLREDTPLGAQTGPARRSDTTTLEQHRALLGTGPLRNLYDAISQSIQQTYEDEL